MVSHREKHNYIAPTSLGVSSPERSLLDISANFEAHPPRRRPSGCPHRLRRKSKSSESLAIHRTTKYAHN
eukprot:1194474-Prorocentrum_minimum.AAC.4